jgi:hypothetical protein
MIANERQAMPSRAYSSAGLAWGRTPYPIYGLNRDSFNHAGRVDRLGGGERMSLHNPVMD